MTEAMQGLLNDAKRNKFSTIDASLSDDDVSSVWDNVSAFIERQMGLQKGVCIHGLGTFAFIQKKLDIGNNKFILIQRPIFVLSEKVAQTHALHYTKYHVPGHIPIVQLNFASLSFESPYDRDTVETCVREILNSVSRAIGSRKNVELTFCSIGRLSIRDSKVKMKFYKEFVNQMDGSGKLVDSLQNRPGTVDSVMSACSDRPSTVNTLVLPRRHKKQNGIQPGSGLLPLVHEQEEEDVDPERIESPLRPMTPIKDPLLTERTESTEVDDGPTANAIRNIMKTRDPEQLDVLEMIEKERKRSALPPTPQSGRLPVPMATATGVSFSEDFGVQPNAQPPSAQSGKVSPVPSSSPKPPSIPKPDIFPRSKSMDFSLHKVDNVMSPPRSACGHSKAGQELCYLCHQRARRNIPVSFAAERKKREDEEERLLQQYQQMKDAEDILSEQEITIAKRHDLQKLAAFNLGVSEGITAKKFARPTDFQPSYVFQKRPLTPPRIFKQEEYSQELSKQVDAKDKTKQARRADEEFLERLEQVQLAEDLAAQREQYLKDKLNQQDMYKRALAYQLHFKPQLLPDREADSEVFGKNDLNNEKIAKQRGRAYDLFREQQELVAQRKRATILNRLAEQKVEEEVLDRTKRELLDDRSDRFQRRFFYRKKLETAWSKAAEKKRSKELEERLRALSPGVLIHEQCDKYHRCDQCTRKLVNCGESNIWSDSRYISGSRLII